MTTQNPANRNDYPAMYGDVVTERHARICREQGHVPHTVDGSDSGVCPRCGTVTEVANFSKPQNDERTGPRTETAPLAALRHHVTGAVERGESEPIVNVSEPVSDEPIVHRAVTLARAALPGSFQCSWCEKPAVFIIDSDTSNLDCGTHDHWDGLNAYQVAAETYPEFPASRAEVSSWLSENVQSERTGNITDRWIADGYGGLNSALNVYAQHGLISGETVLRLPSEQTTRVAEAIGVFVSDMAQSPALNADTVSDVDAITEALSPDPWQQRPVFRVRRESENDSGVFEDEMMPTGHSTVQSASDEAHALAVLSMRDDRNNDDIDHVSPLSQMVMTDDDPFGYSYWVGTGSNLGSEVVSRRFTVTTQTTAEWNVEQNSDWCPQCEKTTTYNGETCTECGRVWGEPEPDSDETDTVQLNVTDDVFTLSIRLPDPDENSDMFDRSEFVRDTLNTLSARLSDGSLEPGDSGSVQDVNGNRCAEWSVSAQPRTGLNAF